MELNSSKSKLKIPALRLKSPVSDKIHVSNPSIQNLISPSPVAKSMEPKINNLVQKHQRNKIYNSGPLLPGWLKTGRRTAPVKALPNQESSFSSDLADEISPSTNQHPSKAHLPLKKRRSNAEQKEAESSTNPLVVNKEIDVHKIHAQSPKQYVCNICDKTFKNYQALGGHKVHHKVKGNREEQQPEGICSSLHECTFCDKIFSTGQALGGHKRHCREPAPEKGPSTGERREKRNEKRVLRFDLNELPTE